jgi:hypothetical protein
VEKGWKDLVLEWARHKRTLLHTLSHLLSSQNISTWLAAFQGWNAATERALNGGPDWLCLLPLNLQSPVLLHSPRAHEGIDLARPDRVVSPTSRSRWTCVALGWVRVEQTRH